MINLNVIFRQIEKDEKERTNKKDEIKKDIQTKKKELDKAVSGLSLLLWFFIEDAAPLTKAGILSICKGQ